MSFWVVGNDWNDMAPTSSRLLNDKTIQSSINLDFIM